MATVHLKEDEREDNFKKYTSLGKNKVINEVYLKVYLFILYNFIKNSYKYVCLRCEV